MKLRIKGNSIRLRLGQSEVRRLVSEGLIEEFTAFGPSRKQRFGYALCASAAQLGVSATFADQRLIVRVPADVIDRWATTDQVSIHSVQYTGNGNDLNILIEKDFECIDRAGDE